MSDVPKKEESPSGTTKEDPKEESVVEPSDITAKDQHPPIDEETATSDKSTEEEPKSGPNIVESTHEDQEIDWNSDQEPDRPGHIPRGRIKPPVSAGPKPPSRPK